jgi:hypothetical protein
MGQVAEFISLAAMLAAYGPASGAQSANTVSPTPSTSQFIAAGTSVPRQIADLVIREIDDPHSGARWLLMRDRNHPAGPGRLVLVAAPGRHAGPGVPVGTLFTTSTVLIPPRPVIRAGDRLVVEENTAVIEARLEAVALGPATLGSTFDVRLKMGGKVARAVALAPGRAAFQAQTEARP